MARPFSKHCCWKLLDEKLQTLLLFSILLLLLLIAHTYHGRSSFQHCYWIRRCSVHTQPLSLFEPFKVTLSHLSKYRCWFRACKKNQFPCRANCTSNQRTRNQMVHCNVQCIVTSRAPVGARSILYAIYKDSFILGRILNIGNKLCLGYRKHWLRFFT